MASPNPAAFSSSAEVFSANNTLPQIRSMHKSLHVQIEEKATRLRTQVGSSYRELLGTADTIVHMRVDNDKVQQLLGTMGGQCGRAVVSTKASGLAKFVSSDSRPEATTAARLKLLNACGLMVDRILRGGGGLGEHVKKGERLVVATKVLVLSRLLISSLADISGADVDHSLEAAKKTRDVLRRRHRLNVEKVMKQVDDESDREDILNALCAYSLVASSGAKDVLRQFLHIRAGAMASTLEVGEDQRVTTVDDIVRGMKLYTMTLLDVQALVPTQLSQALMSLKQHELLKDATLQGLEGLRLDIYERWCSEEIQYFRPFIRHDDLDGIQARERLSDWATKGGQVLLKGLGQTLERMSDFKSITDLRTKILQLWIREGGKARGFDPSEMQDDLREVINSRLLAVIESKVSMLHLVASEIKATLDGWQEGTTDKHMALWDEDGYDTALSNGATSFLQEVSTRLYGRNDAVSKATQRYNTWFHVIGDVKEVVKGLRSQRWDNDFDEIEDEETIESRQQLLSKDDPKLLQEKLETMLDESFEDLGEQIRVHWEGVSGEARGPAVAMYLLRVVRDIRRKLPDRPKVKKFGARLLPVLQTKIVVHVATPSLEQLIAKGLPRREIITRPLWEGTPPLPNNASPHLLEFLQSLCAAMSDVGMDIWSPAATTRMKRHVSELICEAWQKELPKVMAEISVQARDEDTTVEEKTGGKNNKPDQKEEQGSSQSDKEEDDESAIPTASTADNNTDGEDNDEIEKKDKDDSKKAVPFTAEQARELHTQWAFDVSLLQCCLGSSPGPAADNLSSLLEELYKQDGLEEKSLHNHLAKAPKEFWQRISLLFGLIG